MNTPTTDAIMALINTPPHARDIDHSARIRSAIAQLETKTIKAQQHIERMSDFLFYCSPKPTDKGPREAELVTDSFPFYPDEIDPEHPDS